MDRQKLLNLMIEIVAEAGNFALKSAGRVSVYSKNNVDRQEEVVTEVDRAVECFITKSLETTAPNIPVIGEEGFNGDFGLFSVPQYFVVDPIDGTARFAEGGSDWAISLALVENHSPTIGVLYMPARCRMFKACLGGGVSLNNRLCPNRGDVEQSGKIGVSPRQMGIQELRSKIADTGLVPKAISSLTPKIGAIISGEIDAAVYFPQAGKSAKVWDYAAVYLMINEFGGKMCSLKVPHLCLPFSGEGTIHKSGWVATGSLELYEKIAACLQMC